MYKRTLTIAFTVFLIAGVTLAQERVNTDANNLAIEGYDPVGYFTEGAPTPGDSGITYEHNGARYRFASTANRDAFAEDPEAYLPAYGGYCAWAVSQGYTADIDPDAWVIHDDRLYLNFNQRIGRRFRGDIDANIERADANWPGLSR